MKTISAKIFLLLGITSLIILGCGSGDSKTSTVPENAIDPAVVENPATASIIMFKQ